MLVPAILYKEAIEREFKRYYYTDDMMYVTGSMDNWFPTIEDCPADCYFQYAIIDENGRLIGYLGYTVDWYCSKVYNFGLFTFVRNKMVSPRDVFNKLEELVSTFHRVEWRAIEGNPACRGYDNFIKKHNGNKHILKDAIKDRYGNYLNDIIYEIVK